MKVLFTSHASVVDVYQDKLKYLANEPDIELHVLLPERYLEGSRVVEAYLGDGSYQVHTLPTRFGASGRQGAFTYIGLDAFVRTMDVDIVHMEEEPESLVTLQLIRAFNHLSKKPRFIALTSRNIRLSGEFFPRWHPKLWVFRAIESSTLRRLDALFCVPHQTPHLFRELGFTKDLPVIPQFGISPERFVPPVKREQLQQAKGLAPFVVGYVGRLLELKGIHILISALALIPEQDVNVVIIGSGPYEHQLKHLVASLNLNSRIRFIPNVPFADIPQWLGALDVLCLPSLTGHNFKEQFGRVIVEALACGTPVIGSDSGEIPYVVGEGGLITREGNHIELAEAIRRLYNNPSELSRLRELGLHRVQSNYTNAMIASRIASAYRTLLQ